MNAFSVIGSIDGRPATVIWDGATLSGDACVIGRAECIVALGETFEGAERGPVLATLDGSSPGTCLTVVRAFSSVREVNLTHGVT